MTNFYQIISHETEVMNSLHQDVHMTFLNRANDYESWSKACEKFHSYVSPIDSFIDQIYESPILDNQETLEFVLVFLEIDPIFFRSGYIKEDMIQKLKKTKLNADQLTRIHSILIDAVENRGQREFKRYCRLAKAVSSGAIIETLNCVFQQGKGARKSRAKLMLRYICLSQVVKHHD
ncbi:hypothetical protein J7384_18400 [Endozoicomonas sp. G2_1]|uniref:hypothetical protein n=1 Tax=Endozoicomonas sp. G2_1 TaxID=2821091 RepID=UPI001ADCD0D7|nr:hypothetical protein [Endozoicomonas sp. G2_1]MBO9492339.1 hypothetical protein [Endozoicomonas sp. G2_1]